MRLSVLALVLCVCASGQDAIQPSAKTMLFNGRDLTGWYTWLRDHGYQDPNGVFTVVNKALRISGQDWGGVATKQAYRNYHLIVEWKWGGKTWAPREDRARDSGILVHGVGEDGAYNKTWLESIESQIIEGGSGDFILVGGKNKPRMTAETRKGDASIEQDKNQVYWQKGGEPVTRESGRFNWWGRDPHWKDVLGFRGAKDVEKPVGQWNRQEVICDGDTITNILNGVVVNRGYGSSHTAGKIQLQSEGAEILIRKVELRPIRKNRGGNQ
ncbi:MAG: DUF1080 domain-containing protein [Bryobacteraceae bacterium]